MPCFCHFLYKRQGKTAAAEKPFGKTSYDEIVGTQCEEIPEITQDNINEMILFYYNDYVQSHGRSDDPGIFEKIWKWIVAHSGRRSPWYQGEPCDFTAPCGPCPGFCLKANERDGENFTVVSDDYLLPNSDYEDGVRLFQAALFNDSIMGLSFVHSNFTSADGKLYIEEDFSIGANAAAAFGKRDIIILEGSYPVSYTYSRNGTTLVKIISY